MSRSIPRQCPPLEVSIMFEPHRLHHDLLRAAYASLLPETRRHLTPKKPALEMHSIPSSERKEGSMG
jgi:hypothetical protein